MELDKEHVGCSIAKVVRIFLIRFFKALDGTDRDIVQQETCRTTQQTTSDRIFREQ